MTYAYIAGGFAAWGLGCLMVWSLALAAGRECPAPTQEAANGSRTPSTCVIYEFPVADRSA